MPNACTIHRVQADQWQRYKQIRLRALAESPNAFGSSTQREEAWKDSVWRDRIVDESAAFFIASDEIAGDIGLAAGVACYDGDGAYLVQMWVAPDSRGQQIDGQRISEQLIDAVIMWARQKGHATLKLDVGDENYPAIRLYERMSFRPNGQTSTLDAPRDHITEHQRVRKL